MTLNLLRRPPRPMLLTLGLCQILAAPLAAHVTAEVIGAGEPIEVALTIGHGCAGAPTTALRVAVPEGLAVVKPQGKPGWEVFANDAEFGWRGGEVDDHQHEAFTFTATVAAGEAVDIRLPVVQSCGETQLRWIDHDPGADNPAPLIRVPAAE